MKQRRQITINGFGLIMVACLIFFLATSLTGQGTADTLTRQEYMEAVDAGNVTSAIVKQNKETPTGQLILLMKDNSHRQMYVSDVTAEQDFLMEKNVPFTTQDVPHESYMMTMILPMVLSTGMVVLVIMFMNARAAGGGSNAKMMNFGKSRAKLSKDANKFNFKKVAGLHEEKADLEELVDFLRDPQKYTSLGARIPKGVLLVGPPGTGKTLLAKAVAGESGVPFFSISGSDFVEMFVGVGASRVRDLFEEAKQNAPCIVFIDEIDAVARQRGTGLGGGHDEREQTLNQLLVEMDGFGVNEGIIVMAATNRVDILDPAILRPGRFDRKIVVGRPDVMGREEILQVHAKDKPMGDDVDLHRVAQTTAGFTGADLENLLNEAAILAARENRKFVKQSDIDRSFIKVGIGAEKHSRVISEKEKRITAYTMPLPEKDEMFNTKGRMLQNIMVSLGGRIAEELIFDDITTGASQDIKQATAIARSMVVKYGMSEKVGMINYENEDEEVFIGRDIGHAKNYGEGVASVIDSEVKRIIDECYAKAKAMIEEHIDVLHKCSDLLIQKEKIGQEEFEQLFE